MAGVGGRRRAYLPAVRKSAPEIVGLLDDGCNPCYNQGGEQNVKVIPKDIYEEIVYMCGSIEESESDYLRPILEAHGYDRHQFGWINVEQDHGLMMDIYEKLFEGVI